MTQEQFHHIASLNNRLAVLDAFYCEIREAETKEHELERYANENDCCSFRYCDSLRYRLPSLSYVKLVIKDCNSREVELSPCEWHTLINAAIDNAAKEKNEIIKEIESL